MIRVLLAVCALLAAANPLSVVVAQRDAAIQQRDAFKAERDTLRAERNAIARACRVNGMSADEQMPTWLEEVLPDGSERRDWCETIRKSRGGEAQE
jgi:cell division protein FtsL